MCMSERNILRDAVYGAVIGDALGVPYEFEKRGSFVCTRMRGYGTHNQKPGTWSDDSSMLLATCRSLKDNNGRVDTEDMKQRFRDWLLDAKYTAGGSVFDAGITTTDAILRGKGSSEERSQGNGSLMRILPLAFTDCSDDEIREVSALTHAHPNCMEACVIYVHLARACIMGKDLRTCVHQLELTAPFHRLAGIDALGEDEIQSSGYVVHTLEAALWCVLNTDSFAECLMKAVNLGDDTDTTACVAGGLAGILYPIEDLPQDWYEKIRNKELIDACLV